MKIEAGNFYHIYNQGNNRQVVFENPLDYKYFLKLIRLNLLRSCELLAYTLMPNHYHLMIYSDKRAEETFRLGAANVGPVGNAMRIIQSSYARNKNRLTGWTGSRFRQHAKAKNLSEPEMTEISNRSGRDYIYECFMYIHQNPFRAELVRDLGDWPFSSYHEYAGDSKNPMCNLSLAATFGLYRPERFPYTCHHHNFFPFSIQEQIA